MAEIEAANGCRSFQGVPAANHKYLQEEEPLLDCIGFDGEVPFTPFPLPESDEETFEELSDLEKWEFVKNRNGDEGGCASIYVSTDGPVSTPLSEELRKKLMEEYADTVFRAEIYPDAPERVPGGIHTIKLKGGVTPVYQHPFHLAGERRKAMEDIVQKMG